MVYPIPRPPNQAIQNAVFEYLNNNRHKFDEHGRFNTEPDGRDFVPPIFVNSNGPKPPKLPPKNPRLNREQRFWAKNPVANQLRTPKTDEDYVRERYEERMAHAKKRRKYRPDKCEEHLNDALKRCSDMYWNSDLYPSNAYDGCHKRAKELWDECHNKGKYPEGKMEWANKDMDIVDDSEVSKPPTITFERELEPVTRSPAETASDPYSFGPPWGAPAIYRAPLMPPELQRNIPRNMHARLTPEQLLRLGLMIVSRGRIGRLGATVPRGGANPAPTGALSPSALAP